MALRAQELCEATHGFAKSTQGVASSGLISDYIDAIFASILRSHVWLRKALELIGQIVVVALLVGALHFWFMEQI